MNILYLNNSVHLGGDTKCILKLCKELKNDNNLFIASEGGILQSEFEKLGIKHTYIKDVVNKSPITIIYNILKIRNLIKENDIEIVHSHHRMATLTAKLACMFTNARVIHTQHLCIEDKFKLTNLALRNIQIITVSDAAKRILVENSNLDENKITTIYNTIETENNNKDVDARLLKLKEEGYFVVAQISRAIDYKGVYDFIEIAKSTVANNTNIRFCFIGDGPDLENMRKIIKDNNLNKFIYLLGSKDNVIEHLKYIDLFLLCSYIEGLPLSPLEAFSQRIPVIATNIDGTNEEIINGENGFLVNVKDIEGFKNRILEIYGDDSLLNKLKINSYKTYENNFNSVVYINKHLDIYIKMLQE